MRTVKTDQTGWMPRLIGLRWTQGSMRWFFHAAAHMLFGTHIQNEEQTKINAHTGDEEAVLVDLLCFMEAYEAQIRLRLVLLSPAVSTKFTKLA